MSMVAMCALEQMSTNGAVDGNNANQLFSIVRNDDGSYTATNKATGLVLSVANSNVYGDISSDSASQRLAFTKLTSLLPEASLPFRTLLPPLLFWTLRAARPVMALTFSSMEATSRLLRNGKLPRLLTEIIRIPLKAWCRARS